MQPTKITIHCYATEAAQHIISIKNASTVHKLYHTVELILQNDAL